MTKEKGRYPTQDEIIAYNRLRNKHDKDKSWEMKSIWLRMEYLKHQLAASDRLDGYVIEGHKEELEKLQKQYEALAWDGIYTDDDE